MKNALPGACALLQSTADMLSREGAEAEGEDEDEDGDYNAEEDEDESDEDDEDDEEGGAPTKRVLGLRARFVPPLRRVQP